MTAREVETINETEMFTQALVAMVGLGELTVDQLKSRLEGGLAYAEAQGADKVPPKADVRRRNARLAVDC